MKEIKVGDKMWLGHSDFMTPVEDLREVTVSKVGGKYVTCSPYYREERFHIHSLMKKSEYTTFDKLFFSKEEYLEQKKRRNNQDSCIKLMRHINIKNVSDSDLTSLLEILKKY